MALWQLVHLGTWYKIHHVAKCMSCNKSFVVITGRAHCFHDCIYTLFSCFFMILHNVFMIIYILLILLLWDLSTLCAVDHLWPLIYICTKSQSVRGASLQPVFMSSCLTTSHTCLACLLSGRMLLFWSDLFVVGKGVELQKVEELWAGKVGKVHKGGEVGKVGE